MYSQFSPDAGKQVNKMLIIQEAAQKEFNGSGKGLF
jgi:hypothetical protein